MVPWTAGLGLLVSFTATAGTDMAPGAAGLADRASRVAATASPGARLSGTQTRTHPARRSATRLPGGGTDAPATGMVIRASLAEPGDGLIAPGSTAWNPDLDASFVPAPELGLDQSPDAEGGPIVIEDGATPAIPRAEALSSTTPAPADATPIEVAAANLAFPGLSPRAGTTDGATAPVPDATPEAARHRYADLIGPDAMDREQRCLAEAVYFEARSEPEEGQAAVAQVVLNRVKSGLYPSNVCGVVYQNRHRYMGCQFSFACEGKSLRVTDGPSWQTATRIASAVIEGRTYLSEVGGATHYHADYVKPGWSRRLKKMDVIGRHIFYQLKRGQT
ncbi:hypothetical protein CFIICLFH_0189 [Methylobacterium goesingense]|nr:cell wall hydrolase [Methylobacterium goesingense]GJD71980.1 hypothetical protein CFIICLFH_0189 [Methylobacterium goesingense]